MTGTWITPPSASHAVDACPDGNLALVGPALKTLIGRRRGAPWSPTGAALHADDLYVAEWTNPHSEQHDYRPRVRKVDRDGKLTTVGTSPEWFPSLIAISVRRRLPNVRGMENARCA